MTDLIEHGQLFIGGELADPAWARTTIEVVSPHTEQVIGRVPHASRADVDRAVAAARAAFDEGAWPRTPAGGADRGRHPDQGRDRRTARGDRPGHQLAERLAVLLERPRPGARRDDGVGRGDHGRARLHVRGAAGRGARAAAGAAGAGRGGGGRRAVERPAVRGGAPSWRPRCWPGARWCSSRRRRRRWTRTAGGDRDARRGCRRACCRSSRRTGRSASTWSGTRGSTRCPSPARCRRASA